MPELPEVETIVRSLRERQGLVGRRLSQAELLWARTLALPTTAEFFERIPGQSITGLSRRGKFILIHLDRDTLLIHLRMSGDLRLDPAGAGLPPQNHDRLLLNFADGDRLAFNDTRKFGRVWLAADPQTVLADLGPEPLDAAFSDEAFYRRLTARNRQLKPLLLDQTFLAGLGNIYTDEALHLARLHPLRCSAELAAEDAARLLEAIRTVLQEGIRRNGASIDWVYKGGSFQNHFRAYQRTGQPCPVCGAPIQRILVGQRGTHYCPVCQPLERSVLPGAVAPGG